MFYGLLWFLPRPSDENELPLTREWLERLRVIPDRDADVKPVTVHKTLRLKQGVSSIGYCRRAELMRKSQREPFYNALIARGGV